MGLTHFFVRMVKQMLDGCRRDICVNVHCKNNPNFLHPGKTKEEYLKIAIDVWQEYLQT